MSYLLKYLFYSTTTSEELNINGNTNEKQNSSEIVSTNILRNTTKLFFQLLLKKHYFKILTKML